MPEYDVIKPRDYYHKETDVNTSTFVLCPDCSGPTGIMQLNRTPQTMIPGSETLFFCRDENNCGWMEAVDISVWRLAAYFAGHMRPRGVFNASEIKEFLTPRIR